MFLSPNAPLYAVRVTIARGAKRATRFRSDATKHAHAPRLHGSLRLVWRRTTARGAAKDYALTYNLTPHIGRPSIPKKFIRKSRGAGRSKRHFVFAGNRQRASNMGRAHKLLTRCRALNMCAYSWEAARGRCGRSRGKTGCRRLSRPIYV